MTAVEVCPVCDIAGCRHIRERNANTPHQTEAELDAAIAGLQLMLDQYSDKNAWEGYPRYLRGGIAAISALRTQRADTEAKALRRAGAVAYWICAETRHVTLGQKVETAILAMIDKEGA